MLTIVEYAWCGLGATFGPVVIAALFGKYANRFGVIAGLVVGSVVVAILPFIDVTKWCIIPIIPGFILSMAAIYIVSYLTRQIK
jgi:Na+/proline symporter